MKTLDKYAYMPGGGTGQDPDEDEKKKDLAPKM